MLDLNVFINGSKFLRRDSLVYAPFLRQLATIAVDGQLPIVAEIASSLHLSVKVTRRRISTLQKMNLFPFEVQRDPRGPGRMTKRDKREIIKLEEISIRIEAARSAKAKLCGLQLQDVDINESLAQIPSRRLVEGLVRINDKIFGIKCE